MAINFPTPSAVGDLFTDPSSGNVYVCTVVGPPAQWVGSGSTTDIDGTYLRLDATNDPLTGDLQTLGVTTGGQVVGTQQTVDVTWDLSAGNNWTVGAIVFPQPTNGETGQSGTLTLTAAPTSWPSGGALKYPGGIAPAPTTFPAVVPFYVKSVTEILLGTPTEGIS